MTRSLESSMRLIKGKALEQYKGLPPGYHYTAHMHRMPNMPPLTDRQMEIIRLIADGHSYNQIGRALQMKQSTVKNHVYEVFDRLGAVNQANAIFIAMKAGILT